MLTTIECCALSSSATSSPWTLSRGAKKVRWSSGYPSRKRPSALYVARSSHTSGASAIVTPLFCLYRDWRRAIRLPIGDTRMKLPFEDRDEHGGLVALADPSQGV